MIIGLTYDLKSDYLREGWAPEDAAEFDSEITIEAIESALAGMGHEVRRIGNIRALVARLAAGERWDMVFNIAEGAFGLGREAQVPALLDAWRIPYTFSGPEVMALTLHKGMTNAVARSKGVRTADFAVVSELGELGGVALPFPLFCKPVAEGTSKGITEKSLVRTPEELRETCAWLLERFRQPVLVETFLPGREFTVGILGSGDEARAIGVIEVLAREGGDVSAYTYDNKQDWEARVEYVLRDDADARAAGELAVCAWRALGCLDGGRIDVRLDAAGRPTFIEVNPLAGLNPVTSDLPILCGKVGFPYDELIRSIARSALRRAGLEQTPPASPEAARAAQAGRARA